MWFNLFKHKKKEEEPRIFEGRFVTDEEIAEMIRPKKESFIQKEFREINEMMEQIRTYSDRVK